MYRCPFLKTCSLLVKIYMYKEFIYIFIECYHFRQVNGKALMHGLYTIQRYHRVVNVILKGLKSQGGHGF